MINCLFFSCFNHQGQRGALTHGGQILNLQSEVSSSTSIAIHSRKDTFYSFKQKWIFLQIWHYNTITHLFSLHSQTYSSDLVWQKTQEKNPLLHLFFLITDRIQERWCSQWWHGTFPSFLTQMKSGQSNRFKTFCTINKICHVRQRENCLVPRKSAKVPTTFQTNTLYCRYKRMLGNVKISAAHFSLRIKLQYRDKYTHLLVFMCLQERSETYFVHQKNWCYYWSGAVKWSKQCVIAIHQGDYEQTAESIQEMLFVMWCTVLFPCYS